MERGIQGGERRSRDIPADLMKATCEDGLAGGERLDARHDA